MEPPLPRPTYDLLGNAFYADPAPVFAQMRRNDPVHWNPALGAWVITRYDDVDAIVRDPSFSVNRGGLISRTHDHTVRDELAWCSEFVSRWMVFADPPRHTRVRTAARAAFSRTRIEALRPVIAASTEALLDRVAPTGRTELLADLAIPVPALVTAELLGLPRADAGLFKRWTADMFALFGAGESGVSPSGLCN